MITFDRNTHTLAHALIGVGSPVWSVAFLADDRTLLTGGADRMIRRWDAETAEAIGNSAIGDSGDPLARYAGDPGAQVFRACIACHTLEPDAGVRAGPTLHGIFGRRIATVPGYTFSEALKRLDIVWTPETVARLFEIGPARYTPGTKMPEQQIGSPEDRNALVRFLERAARESAFRLPFAFAQVIIGRPSHSAAPLLLKSSTGETARGHDREICWRP